MLKIAVSDIAEVPEAYRGAYEEREGKFHLKIEGLEDTGGLKKALEAERKRANDTEKELKRWKGLGKTDEEIATLLREREEAEKHKAEKEGDFQKLLKQHQDKSSKREQELLQELDAARSSERSAIIETSVTTALTKAGASEEGLDLLPERLAGRIKFETQDGKRVLTILQADGETPMAGAGKDGKATFDDLVKEALEKWPSLFKGSGAGGSGTPPRNGAGGAGSNNDLSKLSAQARLAEARKRGLVPQRK